MVPAGPARSPGRHAVSEPADLAYLCHHYEDSPPRWTGVMRLLSAARHVISAGAGTVLGSRTVVRT